MPRAPVEVLRRRLSEPPALAFTAAETPGAQDAIARMVQRYGQVPPAEADVIVALGGDGHMLETLHANIGLGKPIFGLNRGSVGFLMNGYGEEGLASRIERTHPVLLHPLRMIALDRKGNETEGLAINEVSLLRQSRQAAKIRILVDGVPRLAEMTCDGVLVATPAGSTAYNYSVFGPILPLSAGILALTPISVFRPRRWRGALLPHTARIVFEMLEGPKRPVSAVADYTEVREVQRVEVFEDRSVGLTLLFDPEHNLEERILNEQFTP